MQWWWLFGPSSHIRVAAVPASFVCSLARRGRDGEKIIFFLSFFLFFFLGGKGIRVLDACCDYLELFSCLPFSSHLHDRFMIAMWRTWSLYLWSGLFSAALPSLVMILTMTHPHIRAYLSRLFICCNTFEAWFWWGWWWVGGGLLPGRDFLVTSCWDRKWGGGEATARAGWLPPIQPPANILHFLKLFLCCCRSNYWQINNWMKWNISVLMYQENSQYICQRQHFC